MVYFLFFPFPAGQIPKASTNDGIQIDRRLTTLEKMNATPQRQVLNEAFKRFHRLPDWPVAELWTIRAGRPLDENDEATAPEITLRAANDDQQRTKVLTG